MSDTQPTASGTTGEGGGRTSRSGSEEGEDRRAGVHEADEAAANRAQRNGAPSRPQAPHRHVHRPSPPPDRANSRLRTHTSISPSLPPPLHPLPQMLPRALLPLLHCPLCSPPRLLSAPVSLHCGHTFCASHLTPQNAPSSSNSAHPCLALPRCPLPTCSSSPSSPAVFSHVPPIDVTTNKLINLLTREQDLTQPTPSSYHHNDRTDSEYDSDSDLEYLPLPPPQCSTPPPATSACDALSPPPASTSAPTPRHRLRSPSEPSPRLHPRKRRRRVNRRRSPSQSRRNDHEPTVRLEKELLSELTCEICFGLFLQPVTTPCQHTFCTRCLFRSLDHNQTCPLCRQKLPGYDYFQQHPCNKVILAIILKAFPGAYAERNAAVEAEEHDARLDTPVFVCQLSFPGMPTLLHFFEPRYRLMLRRCLESPNPCFGMIPPPRAAPSSSGNGSTGTGNDYGTMLQIRNVQTYPDGRSLVETWGTWRFRIMERGIRDGYTVARVERIEDYEEELDQEANSAPHSDSDRGPIDGPSERGPDRASSSSREASESTHARRAQQQQPDVAAGAHTGDVFVDVGQPSVAASPSPSVSSQPIRLLPSAADVPANRSRQEGSPEEKQAPDGGSAPRRAPTNTELMQTCRAFIEQTRQGTPWVVQHLNANYVPMPDDPASFSFWMALLLPIDEHEKAKLLPIRSPRLRLRLIVHWIEQLNSHWWFSGGCVTT